MTKKIAIVDYSLGNLFSVRLACEYVGLQATVTASSQDVLAADAVILPGVGAFGDAIQSLQRLDLVAPLKDFVAAGKPLIGICLGMQLLMSESYEFGWHAGLDLIPGSVVRFDQPREGEKGWKVPQVGWNGLHRPVERVTQDLWEETPLAGLKEGAFVYFVHSFYVKPADSAPILSVSRYGNIEFCSSLRYRNIFAFQFHPERSGPQGLAIYRNLANLIQTQSAS